MLLAARYVLPVSSAQIENGGIVVRDGKIVDVGTSAELKVRYPDEKVINFGLAALMPGFVDAHTHLEYSAMRGFVDDVPYAAWKTALADKERLFSPEDWEDSAMLGGLEAIASGITTVADITSTGASLHTAQQLGMRGVVYREVGTMVRSEVKADFERGVADIEDWRSQCAGADSRISIGIAPNSLYMCNPNTFKYVAEYAQDGTPVAVHLAGSMEEYNFIKYGELTFSFYENSEGAGFGVDMPPWLPAGASPVQYLLNWDLLDLGNVLAIHCVHVDENDIRTLAEYKASVVYCPRCNAKLSMGIAPVRSFMRAGLRVGLGTDSPAASGSMDPIAEMRIGLLLQRAINDKRDWLDCNHMIEMATLGSARALGIDSSVGSLDKGKYADIVAIDLSSSHQAPTHNPYSAIVHTANQDSILMTMVQGDILYDGRHLGDVDTERIRVRAEEMRQKLRS